MENIQWITSWECVDNIFAELENYPKLFGSTKMAKMQDDIESFIFIFILDELKAR